MICVNKIEMLRLMQKISLPSDSSYALRR